MTCNLHVCKSVFYSDKGKLNYDIFWTWHWIISNLHLRRIKLPTHSRHTLCITTCKLNFCHCCFYLKERTFDRYLYLSSLYHVITLSSYTGEQNKQLQHKTRYYCYVFFDKYVFFLLSEKLWQNSLQRSNGVMTLARTISRNQ